MPKSSSIWRKALGIAIWVGLLLGLISSALAQAPVRPCYQTNLAGTPTSSNQCEPVTSANPLPVVLAPSSVITGNGAGTTGAVVGTLAAVASLTTYICGFDVSAIGGTAAVGPITVAGTVGSSLVYQMSSTAAGVTLGRTYQPCIPASAVNTVITVTTTADGTASAVNVNAWGYQR